MIKKGQFFRHRGKVYVATCDEVDHGGSVGRALRGAELIPGPDGSPGSGRGENVAISIADDTREISRTEAVEGPVVAEWIRQNAIEVGVR